MSTSAAGVSRLPRALAARGHTLPARRHRRCARGACGRSLAGPSVPAPRGRRSIDAGTNTPARTPARLRHGCGPPGLPAGEGSVSRTTYRENHRLNPGVVQPELPRRNQIVAGARVPGECRHAHAAVEVRNGVDDGLTLGLRVRELDGILKFAIGNINGGLHDAMLMLGKACQRISQTCLSAFLHPNVSQTVQCSAIQQHGSSDCVAAPDGSRVVLTDALHSRKI